MRNKYVGEDIRARLGNTVIRYKGKPYFCNAEGAGLSLVDLVSKRVVHKVTSDDPNIDISSLDLGYVNLEYPAKVAVYAARGGHRRYKQGVDLFGLHYTPLYDRARSGIRLEVNGDHMFCQGFLDSYDNKFPSLDQAIKRCNKEFSIALSKEVAVMRENDILKVYVKNEEVGWMKLGTTIVNIPKNEISWINCFYLELIPGWTIKEGV